MKRIGILTTYRQPNWGSVLQAYALQKAVEKLGHEAQIIDYIYPNEYHISRGSWQRTPLPMKQRIAIALGLRPKDKMSLLNEFIDKEMNVSKEYATRESLSAAVNDYDIFLAGSDQIWNPNTMYGDMSYMFDFVPESTPRISYASSFSCSSIPYEFRDEYSKQLSKFKSISVRENNGVALVKDLTGRNAKVVMDPTLLLDKDAWGKIADKSVDLNLPDKYIVFYMLAYTYKPDESMAKLLKMVQGRLQIPVVALNALPKSFNGEVWYKSKRQGIAVPEFLNIMRNASFVVTSSFHGTAFSVNFGVPFVSLMDGESLSDDRILTLLTYLEMKDRLLTTKKNNVTDNILLHYNKEYEQQKLEKLRIDSLDFLRESLNF